MDNIVNFEKEKKRLEKALHVVFAKFESEEDMNYKQLFTKKDGSGFDKLLILSFSSDLAFIDEISDLIDGRTEIILGCDALIKFQTQQMILLNKLIINDEVLLTKIKSRPLLQEKILIDKVGIKVFKDIVNHEKIYILSDRFQNTRVILGSANATKRAFEGKYQLEDFIVFDNDMSAYNTYMSIYEDIDINATYDIDKECIVSEKIVNVVNNNNDKENKSENAEIDIEKLPISKHILTNKAGLILNETKDDDIAEYITEYTRASKTLPKVEIEWVKEGGKKLITPEKFIEYKKEIKKAYNENKEKERAIKKLKIDYDTNLVFFDNKPFDLDVKIEDVKKDILIMFKYFDGYSQFIGTEKDILNAKKDYYKILNIMFSSVFISKLRHDAVENDIWHWEYPIFTIVVGKKSAGKSNLIETVHQMMFMKKTMQIPTNLFTGNRIKGILCDGAGRPIFIDELKNEAFNKYSGEIIKTREQDALMPELDNHPTFIIASNDIAPLKPEIAKRACYFRINISLTNVKARELNQQVNQMRKALTNSLFKEYLKRMIPKVRTMIDSFTKPPEETTLDEKDLFKISSETICQIIEELGVEKPEYISKLNYNDYFENNDINAEVKEKMLRDIKNNRKAFKVNRKENKLTYIAGEKAYEANRVCDSLPEYLLAFVSGISVIMELDKAEEFLGYRFKSLWFF